MSKNFININGQQYVTDSVQLPADRKFRDAWLPPVAGVVTVDMEKAKAITKERIARERYAEYEKRGGPFGPAITDAERSADADPRIDAASTPAELKDLTFDKIVKGK